MTNFSINFTIPWLLILIVPALLFTLIPYFRMNKRYRGTRNRIVSMMLHVIIMVLAISVLAGIDFSYDLPNSENEVILLVDASFSNSESEKAKNDFVESVIASNGGEFKLGIVTFGFDQVYAVELTNDMSNVVTDYLKADVPDDTATDIESALLYTAGLFKNPDGARIVLITDAVETDGVANNVIKSVAAQGVTVDTVYFRGNKTGDEVQIIGMERPEEKIKVGEPFKVNVTVQSSYAGVATIVPYDNGVAGLPVQVELVSGIQSVEIPYEFAFPGMHEMYFEMTSAGDNLTQNNQFTSYIYLESSSKILILESIAGESESIVGMLDDDLQATVINISDTASVPYTVEGLRAYDEVILCNISNADMPEGFDKVLYEYVYEVGGGLFTVCGNEYDANTDDDEWTANAYTRDDMWGSLYQQMLPVEIINYTPPVAVVLLIDVSGSMWQPGKADEPFEDSKLNAAMKGAEACLDVLSERDYVGVVALDDYYLDGLNLTPRTQRDKILSAINSLKDAAGGGTVFSAGLMRAGRLLAAQTDVERRHIILITDGEPSDQDTEQYKYWMQQNAEAGITHSIIGVQATATAAANMKNLLVEFGGMTNDNYHNVTNITNVPGAILKDLSAPEIKDVNYKTFTPTIKTINSVTAGILQEDMPTLDGFYGMKPKEGATVVLMGEYTPVYTQWKFGAGTVGTFACDLNGTWSGNFIDTDVGDTLVNNMIRSIFPEESVRLNDIEVEVEGDNYRTTLNIFTDLEEGQYLEVHITSPGVDGGAMQVQTLTAGASDSYTKLEFAVKTSGIHEIVAQKRDASGNLLSETVNYKALAYSLEYNAFPDTAAAEEYAAELAKNGRGALLTDPWQVYENVALFLHKVINPKISFIIAVIVLFLLDMAVRKFKWKWPHEIIRDKKAKQALGGNDK